MGSQATPQQGIEGADAGPTDAGDIEETQAPLFLFDGVCGFCDRLVQLIIRHDPDAVFRFAPLQGETAAALRARFPEIPRDLDTAVYVEAGRVYLRSRAIFQGARRMPMPWRALSLFSILPAWLTDVGYRFVAKIRYSLFGRHDTCKVPTPEERARFLP